MDKTMLLNDGPAWERTRLIQALRMAIHEAEGWYDDARGSEPDGRVPGMHYCYEILEMVGAKTLREELQTTA